METLRTCSICAVEKPITDFYLYKKIGYRYRECKACTAARRKAARAEDPEKYNEWHRAYRAKNREREKAYREKANKKDPDRHKKYTSKWRKQNPAKALLSAAKTRAAKYGVVFSITEDDIVIPPRCPVLDIPFGQNTGRGPGNHRDSMSLDRIDSTLGYIPGNVQVISGKANTMKNDATPGELLKFADWIRRKFS